MPCLFHNIFGNNSCSSFHLHVWHYHVIIQQEDAWWCRNPSLVPSVVEADGGRAGRQGQAWLLQLAGRAVASGRVIRPPAAWHTPSGGTLVALTPHRGQQRLSGWLHTQQLSSLLLRRTKPDGVSWLDALDAA